jgi:rubrerythrin
MPPTATTQRGKHMRFINKRFECSTKEFAELKERNVGYCAICGTAHEGIEPDARNYKCDSCDAKQVFGLEELMIMGRVTVG